MTRHQETESEVLEAIAKRPFYIAYAMRLYRQRLGLDEEGLAAELGCPVDKIAFLATSRAVRPTEANFETRVGRLAAFVKANPMALRRVLLEETRALPNPPYYTGRCEPCGWDDAPRGARCFDGTVWLRNHVMVSTGRDGEGDVVERCWVCRHGHPLDTTR